MRRIPARRGRRLTTKARGAAAVGSGPPETEALFELAGEPSPGTGTVPIRHRLLDRLPHTDADLRALASQLPPRWVDVSLSEESLPRGSVSATDAIALVASRVGISRLLHLELVPGMRSLFDVTANQASALFNAGETRRRVTSVLYVGAPGSQAPVHTDRHHNLFLHLRGVKKFVVGCYEDPARQLAAVEDVFSGRSPRPEPSELERVTTHTLRAGDGLYVPPDTFHWIENGDYTTASVNCAWTTAATELAIVVHTANSLLRRLGLRPGPPGRHPTIDRVKASGLSVASRARSVRSRR